MVNDKNVNQMQFENEPDYLEKDKTRQKRRKQDFRKAKRKEQITREIYHMQPLDREGWHYYKSLHQYSKNKIHCSCPMCSALEKTNLKKLKGKGYGTRNKRTADMWEKPPVCKLDEDGNLIIITPGIPKKTKAHNYWVTNERKGKNWSMKDTKRIQEMDDELKEYNL